MTHAPASTADASIADHLKSATWDLHQAAENGQLQRRLVKGELGREAYAAHLGQLLHIHEAMERAMDAARDASPVLAALDSERLRHADRLRDDLRALSADAGEPVPAAADFAAWCEALATTQPHALIGPHYVLEGSTNGNGYIAKKIGPAIGLEGEGLSYLRSYGDDQRQRWLAFRSRLDGLSLEAGQLEDITTAARHTFQAIGDISQQLLERLGPLAEPAAR